MCAYFFAVEWVPKKWHVTQSSRNLYTHVLLAFSTFAKNCPHFFEKLVVGAHYVILMISYDCISVFTAKEKRRHLFASVLVCLAYDLNLSPSSLANIDSSYWALLLLLTDWLWVRFYYVNTTTKHFSIIKTTLSREFFYKRTSCYFRNMSIPFST